MSGNEQRAPVPLIGDLLADITEMVKSSSRSHHELLLLALPHFAKASSETVAVRASVPLLSIIQSHTPS